ncbi:isoprenylcysteine carboxyl methyltransferase [Shewanella sp. NFH-SH190041]|uniref:methyltransferase family protein n=1 Tax=Shewanella sp. NFH-SH190041 TaxID=2950245 RepID=UPI0021C3F25C|nr:isoprenylcysteine carboxylmethyltransferase family protein [Shewanella sp. NFH-SH190041]BDM62681.1 isoprenylcysteine carboxyl methyltransferase [Shewanella sp. NFH-SH190041]
MTLKIPPLLLIILFLLLAWLVAVLTPTLTVSDSVRWGWLSLWSIFGVVFAAAGILAFRRQGTTVDPRVPQQASSLVCTGIYCVSRNPMYVGFAGILLGWIGFLASPVALLLLPLFIRYLTVFQIKAEEAALRQRFGIAFDRYCLRVRRWL